MLTYTLLSEEMRFVLLVSSLALWIEGDQGKGKSDNEQDEKRKQVNEEFVDIFTYIWMKKYCAKMFHINVIIK